MNPMISIEVVRGKPGFANACRIAAVGLAMTACAQASDALPNPNASLPFARAAITETSAATKIQKLLPNQTIAAEKISPEQLETIKYGRYPPVKTNVLINGKVQTHWTLHPFDLVRLVREAAQQASRIEGIKVDSSKVGAVMMTESSLVARTGWSSNGKTPSFGLGQLESNTAKSLGVQNPNDPREAAVAIARLVAQGQRFANANRQVEPSLAMSLAYNTSTALRTSLIREYGGGLRMENLPQATQNHVQNMRYGEQRMAVFQKLFDQHEKAMQSIETAQAKAADFSVAVATAPVPVPSTKTLVAGVSNERANQLRLQMNQEALEKAGHPQPVPLTVKGLADMREYISKQLDRIEQIDMSKSKLASPVEVAHAALRTPTGSDVADLAQTMIEKVRGLYNGLRETIVAALSAPKPPADPITTTRTLISANLSAANFISVAALHMQDLREKLQASHKQSPKQV